MKACAIQSIPAHRKGTGLKYVENPTLWANNPWSVETPLKPPVNTNNKHHE